MTPTRRAWSMFAGCGLALAAALAWISATVLRLECAELRARAEAEHQSTLRLALWRMDSWLAPQLAREAARPYFEYQAYFTQQKAYTRIFEQLQPGEVLTPSPLLTFRSTLFPLHFQRDAAGRVTSPQIPTGNWLDLTQQEATAPESPAEASAVDRTALLAKVERVLGAATLDAQLAASEAGLPRLGCSYEALELARGLDYQTRQRSTNSAKISDPAQAQAWVAANGEVTVGPLLPVWCDQAAAASGAGTLLFVRRVQMSQGTLLQGMVADWPQLQQSLLAQLSDLLPAGATSLSRIDSPDQGLQARMLATVPAALTAPPPPEPRPAWTPTRTMLVIVALATALALVAAGWTLRSAMALSERRARFASAVTHELRTPLTTFRLYSEMLAEDMLRDASQRHEYLMTLQREADRLSRLVENVLCYARLEEGRYRGGKRARVTVAALLADVLPPLRQRTQAAGMQLELHGGDLDAAVEADQDAIAQILFNLVDNACKYAQGVGPPRLELFASATTTHVELSLRDFGPGVPLAQRRAIFRPFERGGRQVAESAIPGVGLGLALARGLAADLGGSLVLDTEVHDGARFVLRLPRAA